MRKMTQDQAVSHTCLGSTLWRAAPGIFCVGYTLGLGGVAKLAGAGVGAGAAALWPVLAGGLLFWLLLDSAGRFGANGGGGVLRAFKTCGPRGRVLAWLVVAGVVLAQWSGLPVLVEQVAHLVLAGLRLAWPDMPAGGRWPVVAVAAVLTGTAGCLLWTASLQRIAMVMLGLVMLAGLGFLGAIFPNCALPGAAATQRLTVAGQGGSGPVLALLGIALAAPTLLARPILVRTGGWGWRDRGHQGRDARIASVVLFSLGVLVVLVAADRRSILGAPPGDVLAIMNSFESSGGTRVAAAFVVGSIGAGLSSIVPMLVILPLMIADLRAAEPRFDTRLARGLIVVACCIGMTGALFDGTVRDVHRIASQAAQLFMPPLVVGALLVFSPRRGIGRPPARELVRRTGLVVALGLTLAGSVRAFISLAGRAGWG